MGKHVGKGLARQLFAFVIIILCSLILAFILTTAYVKRSVRNNITEMNQTILEQTNGKIEDFYETMNHIAAALVYSPVTTSYYDQNNRERVLSTDEISATFSNTVLLENNIAGIYLFDMEKNQIASFGANENIGRFSSSIRNQMECSNQFYLDSSQEGYYLIYYPVYNLDTLVYGKQNGMAVFLMKSREFDNMLKNSQATKNTEIYLLDGNNAVVTSCGGKAEYALSKDQQTDSRDYFVQVKNVVIPGWKLVSRIPKSEMYTSAEDGRSPLIIAYLFSGVLILIFAWFCYRNFLVRMHRVDQFITGVINRPEHRMKEERMDEIGSIVHNLNQMLDDKETMNREVQKSQQRVYEMELSRKQLQIQAYQNQINPHFLYNTFDCIRGMALYKGEEEIAQITMALSKVFRFAVKGDNIVTVKEEMDYIREYATIIDYRFMGKIEVDYDIDEDLYQHHVIKLMLQPIVENAVFHGLEQKVDGGTVEVSVQKWGDDRMRICVEDDGCGMSKERLEEIRSNLDKKMNTRGIGMSNIYQRLLLFYGEDIYFDIDSKEGKGTKVTIIIPEEIREER